MSLFIFMGENLCLHLPVHGMFEWVGLRAANLSVSAFWHDFPERLELYLSSAELELQHQH